MLGWTQESIKQWVSWMQWLDRWGYITACVSFLFLGMLIFAYSWVQFIFDATHGFLEASITLINDLLLVIILLELFRTVVRYLQTDVIRLEPFLHVGIIASVRRLLTAGAELTHVAELPQNLFVRYLLDMGLHVLIILVLMVAIYMVRKIQVAEAEVTPTLKKG